MYAGATAAAIAAKLAARIKEELCEAIKQAVAEEFPLILERRRQRAATEAARKAKPPTLPK